jgi:hypothetical protein
VARRWLAFAASIVLLVGSGCFSSRSEGPGVITGYVYNDATGEGIAGARVVLVPSNITIQTGPDGAFRLEDIPSGKYTVRASAAGYVNGSVTGVSVSPGKVEWAKVFLKRRAETDVDETGDN